MQIETRFQFYGYSGNYIGSFGILQGDIKYINQEITGASMP